jgi:energy-coupling factor transport system ATP-binding protein
MISSLSHLTYTYPTALCPALEDVSTETAEGSLTLLAGPSAGGKSTLLRVFNGLVPQFHGGVLAGSATVCGLDPARTPARRMATVAGMVFQEPEAQAIADTVEDELAFGMEQQGIARDEMVRRIAHLVDAFALGHLRHRRLATLSGGERQRVAIAAVLAMQPRLLLLDEPTSQLDHEGAEAVLDAIEAARRRYGVTTLIAEHRLARLLPVADTVFAVADGRVTANTPRESAPCLPSVPPVVELGLRLGLSPLPLSIEEACSHLSRLRAGPPRAQLPAPGDELLRVDDLAVHFGAVCALDHVSLSLAEGELVALVGPNGSGKTTLLRAITGLATAAAGSVSFRRAVAPSSVAERARHAGLLPQDPAYVFFRDAVTAEIRDSLRARGLPDGTLAVDAVLDRWQIAHLAERNPRDVSVGQQQLIALAAMLAHRPPVWLLDEPTRGADGPAKAALAGRLRLHAASGGAAIVATHDIETAARFATRVVRLDHGSIQFDLPAQQAFGSGGPLPTDIARLVPGAVVPADVVLV